MNIVIVSQSVIPAHLYGGTERVIWSLGKELHLMGHKVTFLVKKGSSCPFTEVIFINSELSISDQIPEDADVVHFNFQPEEHIRKPHIVTQHGNCNDLNFKFNRNTVFVSQNHASRFGSNCYVYNGLDWSEYKSPDLYNERKYFHFLGKAAWRIKNVQGAIDTTRQANEKLVVMGGNRLNLKMGFRFTPYPSVKFTGMIDNEAKSVYLNQSKGLVFPIRWHEPFGLAITESLFFGCPVFGTPYGSMPELVKGDVGLLSTKSEELAEAMRTEDLFSPKRCHEYANDLFNSKEMAYAYLIKYELVIDGRQLNEKAPQLVELQDDKFLPFE